MEILILLKANIKQRMGNFIGITLFMTIIVTMLTVAITTNENIETYYDQANDNVNSGDLVVYLDDRVINDELLIKVRDHELVKSTRRTSAVVVTNCLMNESKLETYIYLTRQDRENYPYKVFDDNLSEIEEEDTNLRGNEIYVPIVLRKSYSLQIGDKIKVEFADKEIEYRIKGYIEEPFMGANVMGAKAFVLSDTSFDFIYRLGGEDDSISHLSMYHIFFHDTTEHPLGTLTRTLDEDTNISKLGISSLTIEESKGYTLLISGILSGVLQAFVWILFIILLLVLANNIQTSIEMEYENLGILKSQGFTKGKIRFILILQHILPSIIGTVVGLILANGLTPFLRKIFIQTTGLVYHTNLALLQSLIRIMFLLIVLVIIVFIKSKKVTKISPIVAISGGLEPVYFNNIIHNRVISDKREGILVRLSLRQLTSNVKQYVGTTIVLTILVLFVCLTASFQITFTKEYYNEMFGIVSSDIHIEGDGLQEKRLNIEGIINKYTHITDSFFYASRYASIDNYPYLAQILDDMSYLTKILEGRAPIYNNEIAITNLVKNKIHKGIGEKVVIAVGEESSEYIITGIYESCSDIGKCYVMTLDGAKRVLELQENDRYYILNDPSYSSIIMNEINTSFEEGKVEATKPSALNEDAMETTLTVSHIMMGFIYFISILFAIITVAMICNKMFYRECSDMGIYKAYGFTTTQLRLQFCIRFLFLSIVSSSIGAMVYILIGNKLNAFVLKLAGITSFSSDNTFYNVILPGIMISTFVCLFSYVVMYKIKKVNIKELVME